MERRILGCLVGLSVFVAVSLFSLPLSALERLPQSDLRSITGQEGLSVDLHFPNGFELSKISYIDQDGVGSAGTLSFEPVCLETGAVSYSCGSGTVDLTGTTVDVSSDVTLNGSSNSAIEINPATSPSDLDLRIGAIHLGDPDAGSPVAEDIFFNNINWYNSQLRIGTNADEGLLADIDLKLDIGRLEVSDNDGFDGGTSAEVAVRSISLHDGSNNAVTFSGARVDGSGGVTINGSSTGGVVAQMPDGTFTLETGSITTNECCSDNIVNSTRFSDVNFSGSSVEIGANP